MIIDGKNLILGRLAAYVAKQALLGEKIIIVNSEDIIISGDKHMVLGKYQDRIARGDLYKGPFQPKTADRIVRRTIRGMLPFKQERGRTAYKRVMCYKGIPDKYKNEKLETVERANASKLKTKFTTLGQIEKLVKR